jgi:hypothetical protein
LAQSLRFESVMAGYGSAKSRLPQTCVDADAWTGRGAGARCIGAQHGEIWLETQPYTEIKVSHENQTLIFILYILNQNKNILHIYIKGIVVNMVILCLRPLDPLGKKMQKLEKLFSCYADLHCSCCYSTRPPNEQEVSNLAALYKIRCWNLSIRLHARVGVNLSRVKPKIGHDGPLPKLVKKGHCSKRTNFSCSSYTFSPRKCMTQCKLYQSYRIYQNIITKTNSGSV